MRNPWKLSPSLALVRGDFERPAVERAGVLRRGVLDLEGPRAAQRLTVEAGDGERLLEIFRAATDAVDEHLGDGALDERDLEVAAERVRDVDGDLHVGHRAVDGG